MPARPAPYRFARSWSTLLVAAVALALAPAPAVAHPDHEGIGEGTPGTSFGGEFPAENIEFLGQVSLSDLGPSPRNGADCWGYVSPSGREYALLCVTDGFAFIEVTDPIQPQIVQFISGPNSSWRDIKVFGEYAYGVSEAGIGVQVFDMTDIDNGNVQLVNSVFGGGTASTHNVAINTDSGYLYRLGGGQGTNNGLRVYDLNASPTNPPLVGQLLSYYVHDAQIVSYTSGPYAGREIAFCCSGFNGGFTNTRLRIVDVTDKSNMFTISSVTYPSRQYAHQGWLSEDRQHFYLNDEVDEINGLQSQTTTHVFSVSDLNNPTWLNSFSTGLPSIDHNLYVHDGMIYQTNYRSGLRVFDAADPVNPVEVAWIDTFPSSDAASFDGAWSNYPFLPSGNILISDINQGLIVCRLIIDRLEFNFHKGLPEVLGVDGCTNIHVMVMENGLTYDPSTLKLFVEDSQGVTEYDPVHLPMYGHTDFWVDQLACGERVRFWVECDSTSGVSFTGPSRAPVEAFERFVSYAVNPAIEDSFETDQGWTTSIDPGASGGWERGAVVGGTSFAPLEDADGSGGAYVTGNAPGVQVDDGAVRLVSPDLPFSADGGTVSYSYWFNAEPPVSADRIEVEYSLDGGSNWNLARTHSDPAAEWRHAEFTLGPNGEFPSGASIRLRFSCQDGNFPNFVEGGVDAVTATPLNCVVPDCLGDIDGDNDTDVFDFAELTTVFGEAGPRCIGADLDGDGAITVFDFSIIAGEFGCQGN